MVDSLSYEQKSEMRFGSFTKKSLKNEVKNFFRDMNSTAQKQVLFSELDDTQVERFEDNRAIEAFEDIGLEFQVLQYSVIVRNEMLYEAISKLPGQMRDIILLAYWLNMTDQEIADETGMKRRTVNYNRLKAQDRLREILKGAGYDADNFFPKHQ
jgi:RNA polymerase sigma factor (sigma-70 family)